MAGAQGTVNEDPHLGSGPDEDASEVSVSGDDSDSGSMLSEDSVLPNYEHDESGAGPSTTLYEACARNETVALRRMLERGVTREEVMELDINGRNGLMLAACKGFMEIVSGLHGCPFLDINHQDNDGNTALMIASQAGFISIVNYILNYFPGVDLEARDTRGFTALIKAAMQGREDCVTALLMAGANVKAVDLAKGKAADDWALKTGRFEVLQKLRRLAIRPCAEQFCESYVPEWPELKELVAKATAAKSKGERLTQCLRSTFTFRFPQDPQDNGVLDQMVRMTTSVHSPLVVIGCRPLCPTSPPEVGKQRLTVPELMQRHPGNELADGPTPHSNGSISSSESSVNSSSSVSLASSSSDSQHKGSGFSSSMRSYLPRSLSHRNSVFPAGCIPQIKVTKSGEPTPKKEKKRKKSKTHLEPPVWKYKEAKEEKKKEKLKEEQEKKDKEKAEKHKRKKGK
ncbi:photoreceptor ankyrin repeat protein [Scleropages formosus]|uniref:Ankyrin repeat domain 33 n=1 Tax=Scleropages formosus TaxID=113540 RepID=A0A8C9VDC9_SCLFO|nr:photoreceptor ankyrin repeat protein-like [Scleropages formosus]